MSSVLGCQSVTAHYGPIQVCRGIDLDLRAGQVTVLTGPNGAGKTTLTRRLAGQVEGEGKIDLGGVDIGRMPPHKRADLGVLSIPDSRGLFTEMTVRENIDLAALLLPRAERTSAVKQAVDRFPLIAERSSAAAGNLSGGEQQMVALARMLVVRPKVLLLDEPSQGLAPRIVQEVGGIIGELRDTGAAVLLVEQHLGLAKAVGDSTAVMINGEITMRGEGVELLDEAVLADAYLGRAGSNEDPTTIGA